MSAALVRPLRSLLRRDAGSRSLLLEAALTVAVVRIALSLVPYRVLRALRRPIVRFASTLSRRRCDPANLVAAVRTASRHIPMATCLTQAIALHLMLERRRIESVVEVGVTRRDGRFAAHAWVRQGGVALIGGSVDSYRPLRRARTSS